MTDRKKWFFTECVMSLKLLIAGSRRGLEFADDERDRTFIWVARISRVLIASANAFRQRCYILYSRVSQFLPVRDQFKS